MAHTSMGSCEAISEHTIPQLNAILDRLPKHLSIKLGVPMGTGEAGAAGQGKEQLKSTGKPPKLSDIAAFCGAFSGVK